MAEYSNALKKNPDEAGRNASPDVHEEPGRWPAEHGVRLEGLEDEGPNDVVAKKAPRNPK